MKKLFGVLALSMACMSLAACGNKAAPVDMDKVWETNVYEQICAFGSNAVTVDGVDVENDWAVKEFNVMTAISLNELKEISPSAEKIVEKRSLHGLYKFEGLVLGTRDPGWRANYKDKTTGEVKSKKGSYAFKACGVDKNEDQEWVKTCHFSSPESHGENLTPDTFFLTDNMTDVMVDGFDHDSNPVAYEAGQYTLIVALYKKGVGNMNITCGLGLVKTAERTPVDDPEVPVTSMTLAGDFNSWGDLAMEKAADGTFTAELTAAAAGGFKVKINGAWDFSLGASALESKEYADGDDNIAIEAGTYLVTVKLGAAAMANFILDKTIEVFTCVPANVQ